MDTPESESKPRPYNLEIYQGLPNDPLKGGIFYAVFPVPRSIYIKNDRVSEFTDKYKIPLPKVNLDNLTIKDFNDQTHENQVFYVASNTRDDVVTVLQTIAKGFGLETKIL